MPARSVTLLLCALGAAPAVPAMAPPHARPPRALSNCDRWQNLIADYSRGASSARAGGGGSWLPSAIPLQMPLQGDNSGRASMTMLVVPVPMPVPAPAQRAFPAQCTLSELQAEAEPPRTFSPTFSAGHQLGYNVPPYIQIIFNQLPLNLYNQVPTFSQPPGSSVVPSHNLAPHPSNMPSAPPAPQVSKTPSALSAPQPSNMPCTSPAPEPSNTLYAPPAPQASNTPSAPPAPQPSNVPSTSPAPQPSGMPSALSAPQPSNMPCTSPAPQPSNTLYAPPAPQASNTPSAPPASQPSNVPSTSPAPQPSDMPSTPPAPQPSNMPSTSRAPQPNNMLSAPPAPQPSNMSSTPPAPQPSKMPSTIPALQPSNVPSTSPAPQPSNLPSTPPAPQPSNMPSASRAPQPNNMLSAPPAPQPSNMSSTPPAPQPSKMPSTIPALQPSNVPSTSPATQPSNTLYAPPAPQASNTPSAPPASQPSNVPSTSPAPQPSDMPSTPPAPQPSNMPSTSRAPQPNNMLSAPPAPQPSNMSSTPPAPQPSKMPSTIPALQPSNVPSTSPAPQPSNLPSTPPAPQPSNMPSASRAPQPNNMLSAPPAPQPSNMSSTPPAPQPSKMPSTIPALQPSNVPSTSPATQPSNMPSTLPAPQPSNMPSASRAPQPNNMLSAPPAPQPSNTSSTPPAPQPSNVPSTSPAPQPSDMPSAPPAPQVSNTPSALSAPQPSNVPSTSPATQPSNMPSTLPAPQPSNMPSASRAPQPNNMLSAPPAPQPSNTSSTPPAPQPSNVPSTSPAPQPSDMPSAAPAPQVSNTPSTPPAPQPSNMPSASRAPQPNNMLSAPPAPQPSNMSSTPPAPQPSKMPSTIPALQPSNVPSTSPATQPSNMPSTPPAPQPSNMPSASRAPQPNNMLSAPPAPQPSNTSSTLPAPQPSDIPAAPPAPPTASVPSAPPGSPTLSHVQCESQPVWLTLPPTRASLLHSDTDEQLARRQACEDSRLLVEQFRAQIPVDPSLPPIGTDQQSYPEVPQQRPLKCKQRRSKAGEGESGELEIKTGEAPPPLHFGRSLFLRARLTVPRAGYTEPYSMWWDAASGAARVSFHGGTTSSYRMVQCDGRVQNAQIRVDRSGEMEVRRCVLSDPRRVPLTERSLPALPDLQAFSFAGYVTRGAERAERWQYTLSGHNGELGGAHGEALTFRHELLVKRSADNYTSIPYWYSVRVDSSLLGADCDGYVHYFDEVQERQYDSSMFQLNIADACEQVENTSRVEDVEPLREFTMLRRDPRHDTKIEQYKQTYGRIYADDREEAVRKNMLMQMTRFTESGNRQGTTMQLATNFLSDQLQVEKNFLLGTLPPIDLMRDHAKPLRISEAELEALRGQLPRYFNWRKIGAVSKVRKQTKCESCWAIATVGAVEGQLFRRVGRLVPLSEQVLVDCAEPYGTKGCSASKQTYAYNYIMDNGLPAYDDYPFISKEQQCRAGSVTNVTRISGYYNVTENNILALKVAIKRYGPTVVTIDGSLESFRHFNSGRYYDENCSRNRANHAMLAVGWSENHGETDFIIKNSWGEDTWGEKGYVRMRMSKHNKNCESGFEDACGDWCGLLRRASLPNLRDKDVLIMQRDPTVLKL